MLMRANRKLQRKKVSFFDAERAKNFKMQASHTLQYGEAHFEVFGDVMREKWKLL